MLPGITHKAFNQPAGKIFLHGEETVSYGQIQERIEKLTTWFNANQVRVGHSVLLAIGSPARFSELFLALLCNGIGVMIANPLATKREIHNLVNYSNPDYLVVDHDLKQKWGLETLVDGVRVLFTVRGGKRTGLLGKMLGKRGSCGPEPGPSTYPELVSSLDRTQPAEPEDVSILGYIISTSGSTSDPKNVVASRRSYLHTLKRRSEKFRVTPESRIVNVLSLSMGDGVGEGPLLNFYNGSTWIRPAEFQPKTLPTILDSLYTYRVTHFFLVPAMMGLVLRLGEDYRVCFREPDLEMVISTAAMLPEKLWVEFERTCGVEVSNLYSLTECSTGLFSGPDPDSRKVGTIGKPYGSEIRILREDGEAASSDEAGELWLRSESIMDGYLNNEAATSQCLVDGWLNTGDLAAQDEQGFVKIVGRTREMIKFAGHALNPAEISEVIETCPGIREVAVVGIDRDEWGEIPVAFVVCENSGGMSAVDLIEFCRETLTEYKVPREVVFVDSLPYAPNGKILGNRLKELFQHRSSEVDGDLNGKIIAIAKRCFRTRQALSPEDSPMTVTGWDSLAHMELVLAIEREFAIRFATREIMTLESLGGLMDLVRSKVAES